jgi:sterol desaturase/sphingolipid hydroxylase (fatty acid hydroxylase superfamily)
MIGAICESRLNYWAAYVTDVSCPCIFAYLGMHQSSSWPAAILSCLLGLFFFTLVEYAIHRWLLHDRRSVLFYLHHAHHSSPEKTAAFLFPTSVLLFLPIWCLLTWGLHLHWASFFLMGLSGGYVYFDTIHHIEHTVRVNQIPFRWLKKRWAFHRVHHRIEQSNFGVTTSLWDHVFGTHQKRLKHRQAQI